jgi:shikimate kinase
MHDSSSNARFFRQSPAFEQEAGLCRLVLTGFMGAGKSTVGPMLATKLGWVFLDVDAEIEVSARTSARELYAALGETAFRELECATLGSCLMRPSAIVAPGGAAIDLARNREALASSPDTLIVFLDAPFATLIGRCLLEEQRGGGTYRPLLHKTDVAQARYSVRRELYSAQAHLIVDVAERSPEAIALQIWQAVCRCKETE